MKAELLSSREAATMLNISPAQLVRWVRQGVVKTHNGSIGKERQFRLSDITYLAESRKHGSHPEAAFLMARQATMEMRAMRRELERIRFVLGLDVTPIGVDRDSVVSAVLKAEDALRGPPVRDPEELLEWARILHALTETHLEAITLYTEQKEPWRVFLALGRKICAGENVLVTRNDPELYSIFRLMHAALRRARQTAYFHIRGLYGKVYAARLMPDVKGCPHEDVIAMSFNNMFWEAPAAPATPDPLSQTMLESADPDRSHDWDE
jgi:hypothetical protein